MAKKQKRLTIESIIPNLKEILNHRATVILNDGQVFFVDFLNYKSGIFETKDIKKRKHKFSLKEIQEIILETSS
ncbi:MAG TPA: hypothetical protein ACFCUD_08610 [Cyclobacteriaceae bacterium]